MSNDTPTPLRADNNPKFYSRFKWLGLAAIAFTLYCLYDGYYNWPDQQVRGEAFMELAEEHLSDGDKERAHKDAHGAGDVYLKYVTFMDDNDQLTEAWSAQAETNGWEPAPPAKLRSDGDIVGQYVMAGISTLGAIYFLTTVVFSNGRWIQLDDGGVSSSWGQSFSFDQVTEISKKQWKDKGIARVKYNDGAGTKTFVVDDYKYHRKTTDEILRQIELRAGLDKITGGKPCPDPDAPNEEPATEGQA